MSLLSPALPSEASFPSPPRRWAGALCLVALFLVMLATSLSNPLEDSDPVRAQLATMAGQRSAVQRLAWLELLAALLFIGVVMTLVGLTRRRGTGLANAGAVVGVCGAIGMGMVSLHHFFLLALLDADRATAVGVSDRLDALVGPALFPFLFAAPISLVLLCAAVARARVVPWTCFAGAVLFLVVDQVPGVPHAEVIQMLVGLVTFSWVAVQMVRWAPARQTSPSIATPQLTVG